MIWPSSWVFATSMLAGRHCYTVRANARIIIVNPTAWTSCYCKSNTHVTSWNRCLCWKCFGASRIPEIMSQRIQSKTAEIQRQRQQSNGTLTKLIMHGLIAMNRPETQKLYSNQEAQTHLPPSPTTTNNYVEYKWFLRFMIWPSNWVFATSMLTGRFGFRV